MDKLRAMEVFVEVADRGSFSGAAKRLEISTAMVSKYIAGLESELDARLVNRSTRKVSLTDVGRAYRSRCRHILNELSDAEASVKAINETPRGRLSIGAPMVFGARQIAASLSTYLDQYPDIEIRLYLREMRFDPLHDGIDVDIRIGHMPDSNLVARRLASAKQIICASPQYLARHKRPRHTEDLAEHNCLAFVGNEYLDEWKFAQASGEEVRVNVNGNFKSNSGAAVYHAVLNGLGLAALPSYVVADDVTAGRLEVITLDLAPVEVPIWAVYAYRQHLSAKVRTFIDFMRERVESQLSTIDHIFEHDA